MLILQNAVQPLLPKVAENIYYEALFELVTIEPTTWIKLYYKLGEEIAGLVMPPGSEIHQLFISKGFKTQHGQIIFIIYELKRHLRRVMQFSPYKHGSSFMMNKASLAKVRGKR